MNTAVSKKIVPLSMEIQDILLEISWSKIAQRYFPDKSVAWFYNKMRGVDGNGGSGDFTFEERIQLKNALFDFSERIRKTAEIIE
ncbi:DUF5053 domain-containing protein [Viscerimonas tarda]